MNKVYVVGSGFAGCVISRQLADYGYNVNVIEKRNVISGNMYDFYDENGILTQKYGPHIIFTNSIEVINYLKKFDDLIEHDCVMMSYIDNKYVQLPFNFSTIKQIFGYEKGKIIIDCLREKNYGCDRISIYKLMQDENEIIRKFAFDLFDKAFRPYIKKQWDLLDSQIDRSVIDRVKVSLNYDYRYLNKDLQFLPKNGFYNLMKNMLNHPNIKVTLNDDAMTHLSFVNDCVLYDGEDVPVFFTGMIDELFNFEYGKLPYRSMLFEKVEYKLERALPCEIVSLPQDFKYIRKTEYKYFNSSSNRVVNEFKTSVVFEKPIQYTENSGVVPCYPIVNRDNMDVYEKYFKKSKRYKNLILCGRLAEYKYYNMDDVILHSLEIAKMFIEKKWKNNE